MPGAGVLIAWVPRVMGATYRIVVDGCHVPNCSTVPVSATIPATQVDERTWRWRDHGEDHPFHSQRRAGVGGDRRGSHAAKGKGAEKRCRAAISVFRSQIAELRAGHLFNANWSSYLQKALTDLNE